MNTVHYKSTQHNTNVHHTIQMYTIQCMVKQLFVHDPVICNTDVQCNTRSYSSPRMLSNTIQMCAIQCQKYNTNIFYEIQVQAALLPGPCHMQWKCTLYNTNALYKIQGQTAPPFRDPVKYNANVHNKNTICTTQYKCIQYKYTNTIQGLTALDQEYCHIQLYALPHLNKFHVQ